MVDYSKSNVLICTINIAVINDRISESLGSKRPKSFEECVAWARLQFQQRFHNEIAQVSRLLTHQACCRT